ATTFRKSTPGSWPTLVGDCPGPGNLHKCLAHRWPDLVLCYSHPVPDRMVAAAVRCAVLGDQWPDIIRGLFFAGEFWRARGDSGDAALAGDPAVGGDRGRGAGANLEHGQRAVLGVHRL